MKMVKYMSSRMDKYYKEKNSDTDKRTMRHKEAYDDISDDNYEKLNLSSNVSVIKTENDLNIDDIKELISEKYDKRKPTYTNLEEYEDDGDDSDDDEVETKEYDLKKVIETAHKNKPRDYDRERLEHLRETQYDILNSLNISSSRTDDEKDEKISEEEKTLINLIKTVNENAERNHHATDSDDLMGDLLGGDETETLEPVYLDDEQPDKKPTILEELEKTKKLSRKEIEEELENELVQNETAEEQDEKKTESPLTQTEELSNSFYTGNYQINKRDMDDFSDLEKEMKGGSVLVKILIVIIVIITIAIAVYLLNKFLNLGLF